MTLVTWLLYQALLLVVVRSGTFKQPLIEPIEPEQEQNLVNKYYASESDILITLRDLLNLHIVRGPSVFSGDRLAALKAVLDLFGNYFPEKVIRIKKLPPAIAKSNSKVLYFVELSRAKLIVRLLSDWVHRAAESVSVTSFKDKIADLTKRYGNPFPERSTEWEHCKEHEHYMRGFTCGVWNLFHAITVQAYLKEDNLDPTRVLNVLATFVQNFFPCMECRTHFAEMVNHELNFTSWVKSPEDVMLWLWRAHNKVNARLAGDPHTVEYTDPNYPKLQFPPQGLCPNCQSSGTGTDYKKNHQSWDEQEVVYFLIRYYTEFKPMSKAAIKKTRGMSVIEY